MGDSDLPQEIVDIISELLQDDTNSLKNCSVLSHSWALSCQRHLFHSLALGGARKVVRFRHKEPIASRSDSPETQYQELDAFLVNSPGIASQCVRFVRLRFDSYAVSPPRYSESTNNALSSVLAKLTRVHTYDLYLGKWGQYPKGLRQSIYTLLQQPSTSSISVNCTEFASPADVASLLIHSQGLKDLSIMDCSIMDPLHDTSDQISEVSSEDVQPVKFRMDNFVDGLLPTLLRPDSHLKLNRLRGLRLRLSNRADQRDLIQLLIAQSGPCLQHLELLDSPMYRYSPELFLQLNQIPNLHTLRLTGFKATAFFSSIHWMVKLFANLTDSLPLEEIEISFMAHRRMLPNVDNIRESSIGERMLWVPLRELDALLMRKELSCLHRVQFSLTVREPAENSILEFEQKLQESLPALRARTGDLLHIAVSTSVY
ncbi:hypothetical protein Hypma_003717 [Hypsizygus marmoreus]|uniref:F-box domain-containing protein n=1 Tax=Hypsizygus marmoreus TaxID=39966 RepID=A0A369J1H7_HYPMA|nr:hypothetical protein Hypma_003717 [Hypsizygus marmoreus]